MGDAYAPLTAETVRFTLRQRALEVALQEGVGFGGAWYSSQKEHWLGWLAEYDGAGAYGRKIDRTRDTRYFYNHIQCAPMLFWLVEALCNFEGRLDQVWKAVVVAPKKMPANALPCGKWLGGMRLKRL